MHSEEDYSRIDADFLEIVLGLRRTKHNSIQDLLIRASSVSIRG
jgi:hypothetical protein